MVELSLNFDAGMMVICFSDNGAERRALGLLAGWFSFTAYADGELVVPAAALAFLAAEGLTFEVKGRAMYEQMAPPLRVARLGLAEKP